MTTPSSVSTTCLPTAVAVCAAADLTPDEPAVLDVPGQGRVAVFLAEDGYHGIRDLCSHQDAPLSDGFLEGCAVECPLHGSAFDLRTGLPDTPPAVLGVPTYDAWSDGATVFLDPVPRTLRAAQRARAS